MKDMLSRQELMKKLINLPPFDDTGMNNVERLQALDAIFDIYIPNKMSVEIYNKLYLGITRSINKKKSLKAVSQYYENHKMIKHMPSAGVIGSGDVFSITGVSGIGKSTAIQKAIEIISDDETEIDGRIIIPCLVVQTPNDCSIKGMLLEILRQTDYLIGSDYYTEAVHTRATTDMLIGSVATVCQNYLGMLIVDEIQNVRLNMKSKSNKNNGMNFIAMLVQLINSSGISIAFVGTPDIRTVFETQLHLARRTVGLYYDACRYDDEFIDMCRTIFDYQYTEEKTEFSEAFSLWLYRHSGGAVSIVKGILYDAQEKLITAGGRLSIEVLDSVFKERYANIVNFINEVPVAQRKVRTNQPKPDDNKISGSSYADVVKEAKERNLDLLEFIRQHFTVLEVPV